MLRSRLTIILLSIASLYLLNACSSAQESDKESYNEWSAYGSEISTDGAETLSLIAEKLDTAQKEIQLIAEIGDVCQAKGCWMTLKSESGESVRVTFENYGFFVPKDVKGQRVIIQGLASLKELEADVAKHYADDAGEVYDPEQSRMEISIVASGVLIEPKNQL